MPRKKTRRPRYPFRDEAVELLKQAAISDRSNVLIDTLFKLAGIKDHPQFPLGRFRFVSINRHQTLIELPTMRVGQYIRLCNYLEISPDDRVINGEVGLINPSDEMYRAPIYQYAGPTSEQFRASPYNNPAARGSFSLPGTLTLIVPDALLRKRLLPVLHELVNRNATTSIAMKYQIQSLTYHAMHAWADFHDQVNQLQWLLENDHLEERTLSIPLRTRLQLALILKDIENHGDAPMLNGHHHAPEFAIVKLMKQFTLICNIIMRAHPKESPNGELAQHINAIHKAYNAYLSFRRINADNDHGNIEKVVRQALQLFALAPESHAFEISLLRMASIQTQPRECSFGRSPTDDARSAIQLQGMSSTDASQFVDFLRHSRCKTACVAHSTNDVYYIEAETDSLIKYVLPLLKVQLDYWHDCNANELAKLRAESKRHLPSLEPKVSAGTSSTSCRGLFVRDQQAGQAATSVPTQTPQLN